MKVVVAMALCVSLVSAPALADAPSVTTSTRGRTWLTGTGIGLIGAGIAVAVLGVNFQLTASDADKMLKVYLPTPESVPGNDEAAAVKLLSDRREQNGKLAGVMLVGGGVLLVGGLACIILDGLMADSPVKVAVTPTRDGGMFVLSAQF